MAKPYKLSDKIQQTGMGKLKQLAFLNFTIREDIVSILKDLNLDEAEIEQVKIFIKLDEDQTLLNIKIQCENKTMLAFLKTNCSIFEEKLYSGYSHLKVELKVG